MKIEFSRSSKLKGAVVGLSLVWFLCSGFDLGCNPCDDKETKAEKFHGYWVACVDNKPTLMQYFGDSPIPVPSSPPGFFNAGDWNCKTPDSPHYKKGMAPLLTGTQYTGPAGAAGLGTVAARDAGNSLVAYLPPLLRDLPFLPAIPNSSPPCDASFPDVLQTVHTNARVTRISTCPFQIKAEINVVSRPVQIAITPDGSMALVTSFDNAVNFIDLTTNKVVFTLTTDPLVNPMGIAITPDGKRAYITSFDPDEPVVQVIDIASHTVTATFMTTLQYPQGATLTPDGSQLWITGPLDSVVDIYDNATNTLVTRLNIGSTTDVAFNSQGTRAYITSQTNSPGVVVVVDTATFQSLKSYQVGAGPTDITMSYADQFLVVNNSLDGSVSVIDLGLNKVSTTKLGSDITGTAFVH